MSRQNFSDKTNRAIRIGLVLLNLALLGTGLFLTRRNRVREAATQNGIRAVVARVNGVPIYARELLAASGGPDPRSSIPQLRDALRAEILREIVRQKAAAEPVAPAEISDFEKTIAAQFATPAAFSEALQKADLSRADLTGRLTDDLQIEHWLQAAVTQVEPSEPEVAAWENANSEAFICPEVVAAEHLAAIVPPRGTAADFREKAAMIHEMEARLRDGFAFSKLIEDFSDDPAKKATHGSLNWFTRDRMEPHLAAAAFQTAPGEISPAVQSRFGFHLLQVDAHLAANRIDEKSALAEARVRSRDALQLKKLNALLADLPQHANVEILEPKLSE